MIKLAEISAMPPPELDEEETRKKTKKLVEKLGKLQHKLIASRSHAVLVVFQGMDGSGKDGAVKNVFQDCHIHGISVHSFKKPTEEEREFLEALPKPKPEDPEREWTMELLYHFVKKQCLEHEISAALLLPKGDFNRLKSGSDDFDHALLSGWRAELLGAELVEWLTKGEKVKMEWSDGGCKLTM